MRGWQRERCHEPWRVEQSPSVRMECKKYLDTVKSQLVVSMIGWLVGQTGEWKTALFEEGTYR